MAQEKRTLKSTTRTFSTAIGDLTYDELAKAIAPNLKHLLDEISEEHYANNPIDENLLKHFHQSIVGDVMPDIAGRWRSVPVQVGNWIPPESYDIPILMHEYILNLNTRLKHADTIDLQIEALAYAEGEFLHIHPFQDFNGRTIRAFLRELLIRLDLPVVDVSVKRGTSSFKKYQDALAEYDNGRINNLIEFWRIRFSSTPK